MSVALGMWAQPCLLSEYGQEMPHSQTTDQPKALQGRDTEHRHTIVRRQSTVK